LIYVLVSVYKAVVTIGVLMALTDQRDAIFWTPALDSLWR